MTAYFRILRRFVIVLTTWVLSVFLYKFSVLSLELTRVYSIATALDLH